MEAVEDALKIIDNVRQSAIAIHVNNHQCKRLADDLDAVGVSIRLWREAYDWLATSHDEMTVPVEAFHNLLTVLKRGQSLVLEYGGRHWVTRLLTRADNRETFEDIHKELVKCKTFLILNGQDQSNVRSETRSEEQRLETLKLDSEKDCGEMMCALDELKSTISCSSSVSEHTQDNVENVKKVLIEKFEPVKDEDCYEDFERLPSYLMVDPSSIVEEAVLSSGGVAVSKAKWLGCAVAVKSAYQLDHGLREVEILTRTRHPNIVQIMGVSAPIHDGRNFNVIVELMGSDLDRLIHSDRFPFTRQEAIDIIVQIARGLRQLHKMGYLHRDIKPSNILVDDHVAYIDIRLSDFGLALPMDQGVYDSRVKYVGTTPFMAPEANASHSSKADVYSFAMTCYVILTGKPPFEEMVLTTLRSKVEAGLRPELLSERYGEDLSGLIKLCWDPNPSVRPDAERICDMLDRMKASAMDPAIGNMQTAFFRQQLHMSSPTMRSSMRWFFRMFEWKRRRKGKTQIKVRLLDGTELSVAMIFQSAKVRLLDGTDLSVATIPQSAKVRLLDGTDSSVATIPQLAKVSRYLQVNPSTFRVVRRVHGDEDDMVQVFELDIGGSKYALKSFKILERKVPEVFTHELDFLVKLNHPHIVRLMGYSVDRVRTSIVMEWMPTDLRGLIDSRPLSRREAILLIRQIALGMRYLHECGVLHRDLKAKNVLVNFHPDRVVAKITDFGVSQFLEGATPVRNVGTGYWRAPEIFRTVRDKGLFDYTPMADVYSFAMVCYEILSGKEPFEGHGRSEYTFLIVDSGLPPRPALPGDPDDALNKLITRCWDDVPQQRPSFNEICARLQLLN